MAEFQTHRPLAVGTPLGDNDLILLSCTGHERLGRMFEYEVELLSPDPALTFEDLLGQPMTVRMIIDEQGEQIRYFNGYVCRFEQVGWSQGMMRYRATLVPWLWFLTRLGDCRIFQELSSIDIIKQVLDEQGLTDIKDELQKTYRTYEYCVQYNETSFDFVSRLLEREGAYYFFSHDDGKHEMVLADAPTSHEAFPGAEEIELAPQDIPVDGAGYIRTWHLTKSIQTGQWTLRDWDYLNPAKVQQAGATVSRSHSNADAERYEYPGSFLVEADGEHYAKVRLGADQAGHELLHGTTDHRGLAVGHRFKVKVPSEIKDFERSDLEREFLVVQAHYEMHNPDYDTTGVQPEGPIFSCSFLAIDANEQFRPERTTPIPRVAGPQTAIVVGKSGDEIHSDEHARIKVQFHWDRDGKYDEKSSCWVRVSQSMAGKGWGGLFTPRIGHEVIVDFIEGDPDRPICTGRVYNSNNPPPYDQGKYPTISTIKTNSSKGGDGFNEIRLDDKKGEEQIFIHAEHNFDLRVKNDRFEWIGNDRHLHVINDKFEHVENNRNELIDADHYEEIGKDRHLKVGGQEAIEIAKARSMKVGKDLVEKVGGNNSREVTGDLYLKGMNVVIEAQMGLTIKVGGNYVNLGPAGTSVKGQMVNIDGGPMVMIACGASSPAGSGKAGSIVSPAAPAEAVEADDAKPGQLAELPETPSRERAKAQLTEIAAPPFKPPSEDDADDEELSWIEIELIDENDDPIPGERYEIELPDGSKATGSLDNNGFARVEGFEPGSCKVTFPNLDQEAWEKA